MYEVQENIKKEMIKKNLTAKDIARVLGCAPGTAGGKLNGFVKITAEEKNKINKFFNGEIIKTSIEEFEERLILIEERLKILWKERKYAPSQTEEAQNTVGQQAALSEGEAPNGKAAS